MVLHGSYILAAIVVAAANLAVLCWPRPGVSEPGDPGLYLDRGLGRTAGVFLFLVFGVCGALCAGSSAIALQVTLLLVTGIVVIGLDSSRRVFVPASLLVSVAAFLLVWQVAIRPLYDCYPFDSMADRVPHPRRAMSPVLSPEQAESLKELQEFVEMRVPSNVVRWRTDSLKALHDETTDKFITSPGFGAMRNKKPHPIHIERFPDYESDTVPQPGSRVLSAEEDAHLPNAISTTIDPALRKSHLWMVAYFVNPKYFGLIESRDRVAGFRPHRLAQADQMSDTWKTQTIDLVGLLLHPEPVVYVSDNLPRMEKLGTIPTRKLTAFEEAGLAAVRNGKDLYASEFGDTLRLLGAIRAVDQCTTCHACDRGELLGAFSYTLGRAKP